MHVAADQAGNLIVAGSMMDAMDVDPGIGTQLLTHYTNNSGQAPFVEKLNSTDFALFQIPPQFAQDRPTLDARWISLQRQAHPDKFAAHGVAAQRLAMQWSVRINEAYQRLKNPLQRAAYLCELHGAPIHAENNTAMPAAFLVQQIEWREALDEANSSAELDRISAETAASQTAQLARCAQLLDGQQDYPAAAQAVRALMFTERFAADVDARYAQLGQ